MKIALSRKTEKFVRRAMEMGEFKNPTEFVAEACFESYRRLVDVELREAGRAQAENHAVRRGDEE